MGIQVTEELKMRKFVVCFNDGRDVQEYELSARYWEAENGVLLFKGGGAKEIMAFGLNNVLWFHELK